MSSIYQLKYAVMPVSKFNKLDVTCSTSFNIVSKCYVVSEQHLMDGSSIVLYDVVFPFQDFEDQDFSKRIEPVYNSHSKCINSTVVSCVFDSFDDALVVADLENKKLLLDDIGLLPFDDNFDKFSAILKKNHQRLEEKYRKVEQEIEFATKDMQVKKSYHFDFDKILENISIYPEDFYIRIVDSLSSEERNYLREMVSNKSCKNCLNDLCNGEKNSNDACVLWDNKTLIGKQLIKSNIQ